MSEKSYQIGIYEKAMPNSWTIEEKLAFAKKNGYDFMEISVDETDAKLARLEWTTEERLAVVEAVWRTGLPIRTMCLSGHRKYPLGTEDEATGRKSLEIMEKAIRLACDLGIRVIQIAGYDEYYKESNANTRALFEKRLKESTLLAAKYSVVLAFETMETPFMDNVEKAMKYVNIVNSPYLKVYPDLGNCTNAAVLNGYDVIKDIALGRGNIAAMHLKETVPGMYREIEFGTGHVDFHAGIREALDQGIRMFVTEFWHLDSLDAAEHVAYSKSFIDKVFGEVTGEKG